MSKLEKALITAGAILAIAVGSTSQRLANEHQIKYSALGVVGIAMVGAGYALNIRRELNTRRSFYG